MYIFSKYGRKNTTLHKRGCNLGGQIVYYVLQSLLDNAPNFLVGCVTQKRYCVIVLTKAGCKSPRDSWVPEERFAKTKVCSTANSW